MNSNNIYIIIINININNNNINIKLNINTKMESSLQIRRDPWNRAPQIVLQTFTGNEMGGKGKNDAANAKILKNNKIFFKKMPRYLQRKKWETHNINTFNKDCNH